MRGVFALTPARRSALTATGGVVLLGSGLLADWPVAGAVGLVAVVAAVLARRRTGVVDSLPLATVTCLAATVVVCLGFGLLGVDVFRTGTRFLALGLVLVAAVLVALMVSDGASPPAGEDVVRSGPASRPGRVPALAPALVPAVVMTAIGVFAASRGLARSTGWMLGGDHLRHLQQLVRTYEAGNLTYDLQAYPRGWHAFVALMLSLGQPARDAAGLLAAVTSLGALVWMLHGVVVLTVARTAVLLGAGLGLGERGQGVAGLVAGAGAMTGAFAAEFLSKGFQTSIVAAAVLAVAVFEVVRGRGSVRAVLATALAVLLVAHAWQLLLPTAGVLWLVAVAAWVRASRSGRGRRLGAAGLLGAALLGLALPSLLAVSRPAVGVGAAAIPGDVGDLPVLSLATVGLALLVLLVVHRGFTAAVVVGATGVTAATAVALAARLGISLAEYYPNKMLATAGLLGLPAVGAVVVSGLARLDARPDVASRAGVVGGGVLTCGVTMYGLALPASSLLGAWTSPDTSTVLRTVTARGAERAAVVWDVGTDVDDATSQMLIDWFTAAPGDPTVALPASTVEEQCLLLRAAPEPVVISARSPGAVSARFTCVDDLSVVVPNRP